MIYIIAHDKFEPKNFYIDKTFDKELYSVFLTAGKHSKSESSINSFIKKINEAGFNTEKEWEFNNYNKDLQQRNFHAPSVFYHTHCNNFKFKNEFIGFMEYDLVLDPGSTSRYKEIISKHTGDRFIIFNSIKHTLNGLHRQQDMTMQGERWLTFFINDYNQRFDDNINIDDFLHENSEELICTQQSFTCDIGTYKIIAKYVYNFISDFPNRSDYLPRPGSILERFIGVLLYIVTKNYNNKYNLCLTHKHSSGGLYF